MCCHENPACVNHRNCCMIGECNCACMPAQNPFGRFDLFLCAPPVFSWIDFSLWIPFKCFFPHTLFLGLTFIYLFFCIVVCWCVFYLFFPFGSVTCPELAFVWKTRVIFSWLICLCDSCFFFFFSKLCCFLDSRSANANAKWKKKNKTKKISVCTASVPVILFIASHYWKKLDLIGPDWVPWWFQAAIRRCHLQCRVDQ